MASTTGGLALTLIGGLIGTIVAPGVGTSIGLTLGGIVGSIAFPADPILNEGPRIGDLSITASTPGIPRPIGYGAMRISGNIIWATEIEEVADEDEVGGGLFGGGGVVSVTYTYFGNWAVAFGEGPAVDVFRIWANNQLIYDKNNKDVREKGLKFTFYPGSRDQLPDPLIVQDKGSRTPAFRNTVYILFENLLLTKYGNRLPQISAEIVYKEDRVLTATQSTLIAGGMDSFSGTNFSYDPEKRKWWGFDGTGATQGVRISDMDIYQETRQREESTVLREGNEDPNDLDDGLNPTRCITAMSDGGAVMFANTEHSTNSSPVISVDSNSREIARFPVAGTFTGGGFWSSTRGTSFSVPASSHCIELIATHPLYGGEKFIVFVNLFGDSVSLLSYNQMLYIYDSETDDNQDLTPRGLFARPKGIARVPLPPIEEQLETGSSGIAYWTEAYSVVNQSVFAIHRISVGFGASATSDGAGGWVFSGTAVSTMFFNASDFIFPGETVGDATLWEFGEGLVYDNKSAGLIFAIQRSIPGAKSSRAVHWVKVSLSGNVIWVSEEVNFPPGAGSYGMSVLESGTFAYMNGTNAIILNTDTGQIILDDLGVDWPFDAGFSESGVWDSRNGSFTALADPATPTTWFLDRWDKGPESVGTIVKDVCTRLELELTDLDTTDIDTIFLPGYMISRQMSGRNAILPLQHFYLFDGVESDFILKFIQRGNASIRTIPQNELGFVSKGQTNEYIKESRRQEVELPERFTTTFLNTDNDYLQETQSAKRILNPVPTMFSSNQAKLDIAASLDPDVVKQQAEKALFTAWEERKGYEFLLSWDHLDLDPTDVVTLTLDAATIQGRITQFDIVEGFAIEVNAIAEATNQFVSTAPSYSGEGTPIQTVRSSFEVEFFVLDSPLFDDVDEPPGRAFLITYWYAGGLIENTFVRAILFKSSDELNYATISLGVREMTWGYIINTLGDPQDGSPFVRDDTNTLTIAVKNGAGNFFSITEAAMLAGGNRMVILKENGELEIIHFQNVTTNADGTLTLDTLIRGRRGTDTMAFTHGPSEVAILMVSGDAKAFQLGLTEENALRFYKALGQEEFFSQTETKELTSEGRALMPYKPSQEDFSVGGGNDITFTWVRRTRVSGQEVGGSGFVPLNEDSEEYELEVLSGPGGSVVRTFTAITSPTQIYTSAQQVTDGFVPPMTIITIKVYQISGQVDRGFSREITLGQALPFVISPTDAVTIGEAQTIQFSLVEVGSTYNPFDEDVTISETVTMAVHVAIEVEDSVTLDDAIQPYHVGLNPMFFDVEDAITIGETVGFGPSAIEDITLTEFVDIDFVP